MRKIIRQAAAVLLSAALLLTGTASAAAQIDPVEERLAAMPLQEKGGAAVRGAGRGTGPQWTV